MKFLNRKTIYLLLSITAIVILIWSALSKVNFDFTDSNLGHYIFFNPYWAVIIVLADKFFYERDMDELKIYKRKISSAGGAISTARDMGDGKNISIKSILKALSGDELVDLELEKQKEKELENATARAGKIKRKKENLNNF